MQNLNKQQVIDILEKVFDLQSSEKVNELEDDAKKGSVTGIYFENGMFLVSYDNKSDKWRIRKNW